MCYARFCTLRLSNLYISVCKGLKYKIFRFIKLTSFLEGHRWKRRDGHIQFQISISYMHEYTNVHVRKRDTQNKEERQFVQYVWVNCYVTMWRAVNPGMPRVKRSLFLIDLHEKNV